MLPGLGLGTWARGRRGDPDVYMMRCHPRTKALDRAHLILTPTPRSKNPTLQEGSQRLPNADDYSRPD